MSAVEQESIWWATLSESDRSALECRTSQPLLPTPDLLVLGSGLVGLAAAYFAAERGARVQIISESRLASDAEYSVGCIVPNASGWDLSAELLPLAQGSRDWWAKLAVRPDFQLDWRVCGAVMVDQERLAPNPRTHMLTALDAGYSVHEVDAEQIALLEPALASCPAGGLHYPSEAVLHPLRAACGFLKGLGRMGGHVARAEISQLQLADSSQLTVQTTAGMITPRSVFVAGSKVLDLLQKSPGASLPQFEQTTRSYAASAPQPMLVHRPVLDVSWLAQLKSGELVLEIPQAGTDDRTANILASWQQRLPSLKDVEFSRRWTSHSTRGPRGLPVIDRISGLPNVWYCEGLDFAAVLLAPMIGKSVVTSLNGQAAGELAPFAAH
jgi:glycine/D-amino acid oxidase-like deaminating enzyme